MTYIRSGLVAATGLLCAAALSACGGSSGNSSTNSSAKATTTTGASASASGSTSASAKLTALTGEVNGAKSATFKASWTGTSSNGSSITVSLEQMASKFVFTSSGGTSGGGGQVIDTGTNTYFCASHSGGGAETCLNESSSTDPLAPLIDLYNGTDFLNSAQAAAASAEASAHGVSLTFSSQTFNGQSADCANISGNGQTGKYCVLKSGVLAYASANGNTFSLTSYSTSVSASDFALPAGAQVVSIP